MSHPESAPGPLPRLRLGFLLLLLGGSAAGWCFLGARILSDPVNHVGYDPLYAIAGFAALLVVAWLPPPGRRWARTVVTLYAVVSIWALAAMDHANVLVEYHRWLKRGAPARPCPESVRSLWSCPP